jgi:hypothetical protein
MFITWFIIFTIITGTILYCKRDEFYSPSDWVGAFFMCLLGLGAILLFTFVVGSVIATDSAHTTCITTTVGTIADCDNAVIITNENNNVDVDIAVYDVTGKLTVVTHNYDVCIFENSTQNIVEKHEYNFTNKVVGMFFIYTDSADYTIKTTDSHIVDGTRVG